MKKKSFSVAMCVYAGSDAAQLNAALHSVWDQTVPPDELVLVADGPLTAALEAVVASHMSDARFRVVRLAQNRGHGEARRAGLAACRHELVALMDADDLSLPDRFEKQLAVWMADESLSVVGGQIAEFIGDPQHVVGKRIVPTADADIKQYMKTRCPFNQVTVMLKKADAERAGGYRDWYCNEDYYLWLRLFLEGARFANVPDVLVKVRVGEDMYKRRGGVRYFQSEVRLQAWMRQHGVIGWGTYLLNVFKRLVLQVLLPDAVRGWVFRRFARK